MIGETTAHPKVENLKTITSPRACDAIGYNLRLPPRNSAMEAEQLNQIAATLAGLKERTADLRRYL
jgi:hypothetical protein